MRKAEQINEQSKWYELTPGCEIYEPGTARPDQYRRVAHPNPDLPGRPLQTVPAVSPIARILPS